MEITKTGYEWCLADRVRLSNLTQWPSETTDKEKAYYEERITYTAYLEYTRKCDLVPNSNPRKTEMYLEYRMYGLVPYNISPIQQGIQFGHAVVEYGQLVKGIQPFERIYDKWANNDKTFIIYNGRTTNENPERLGTMQKYLQELKDNGVMLAEFREPDLNDTLTAIVFLVDERVFNRELYPDFVIDSYATDKKNEFNYQKWVEKMGNKSNVFLRSFLSNFKFA
jgi:hypothetical protein